jgi:hypothetical protein
MRRNKVEVLYLSNHRPDPRDKLTAYSVMADREAKLSLSSQIVSVPDEKTHLDDTVLYVCTDDLKDVNHFIVQENNSMKFFQTIFQETRQIYLRHGKWHNYLLHFSNWQDSSFSILHLKRGKASLKKFIIQILGRTLPTNHRLNLVHSKIYREKSCFLCRADDESIEHIFFQCSHFHDSRLAIEKETIKISFDAISKLDTKGMCHRASKPNFATITEQITKFFFPPGDLLPDDYRMLSAGQIPCLFQKWLNSFMTDQKTILKIGKTIHEHLITSYQKIWKYRCSNSSALSINFCSQLATFPRGVPVHELNEDDYANNVKLSSINGIQRARSKKRKEALRNQVTFSSSGAAAMAPPDILDNQSKGKSAITTSEINNTTDFQLKKQRLSKLRKEKLSKSKPTKVTTFLPESQRFKIPFIIKQVAKDGNCLFRSILAAQGLIDSSHLELRSRCADSVVAEWNNYAAYANFSHKPDTNTQSKKPLPNESEPSLDLLFKNANDYSWHHT